MRVLVAEDNPAFQIMLQTMLTRWGYEVVLARDGQEAWNMMRLPDAPRLAILDWMMPHMDGVEVCRKIRALPSERYFYILLLTARAERKDLVEGMEAGADDYIAKPFNSQELRVRLRAGARILQLQEELFQAQEALRTQATHDALTGIWNHASIFQILRKELDRAMRERSPLAVLMVDLDHFKRVNDTYGHLTGDAVLQEATRRMRERIRSYDSLGRYGGEEFLLVLPGCDQASGCAQAERLRESIAGEPFQVMDRLVSLTCSVGVAATEQADISQADLLVRGADTALYDAKHRGRNRVAAVLPSELVYSFPGAGGPEGIGDR